MKNYTTPRSHLNNLGLDVDTYKSTLYSLAKKMKLDQSVGHGFDRIESITSTMITAHKSAYKIKRSRLYLLKVYNIDGDFTGVCKFGITCYIDKRIKNLNSAWKGRVSFKLHKATKLSTTKDIISLESSIMKILTIYGCNHIPNNKLSGHSEMFKYESWMDSLIQTIK